MGNLLRFLSLTTATQVCLLVNQLVLLPLQLRVWGHEDTSRWFLAIAIANLTTIADLGLRNAGHAQLVSSVRTGDAASRLEFCNIWALTRALVAGLTATFVGCLLLRSVWSGTAFSLWVCAVTVSVGLDTIIIIRGMWLDTLGYFNRVEALFLGMVASRFLLQIIALASFRAPPAIMGWIMLLTAAGGAMAQARLLPEPLSLSFLAGGFRDLRLRSLSMVRLTIAEPASSWVRMSLPVVVFSAISPPFLVTTYVAMRAIFGVARQVINQIARYASVGIARHGDINLAAAQRLAVRAILLSTALAVAVSCVTIADNGRLLGTWLNGGDPQLERMIALSFAVGAIAYGYQIAAGVLMRSGDLARVAKRQYAYLLAAGSAAIFARFTSSISVYLLLLAIQELLIAGLFIFTLGVRVSRIAIMVFIAALGLVGLMWIAATLNLGGLFDVLSASAIASSLGLAIVTATIAASLFVAVDYWDSVIATTRCITSSRAASPICAKAIARSAASCSDAK